MQQRFKGDILLQKTVVKSIIAFYKQASKSEFTEGLNWYTEANNYCKELAKRFNCTSSQAAGIIAAFSPQTGWAENKRFAVSYLTSPTHIVKSRIQTDKATKILRLVNESDIYHSLAVKDKAYKTKAFFLNMVNPDIITDVTIDRHAIAICIQEPSNVYSLNPSYSQLTLAQYRFFADCYIIAAKKLDILPQQLQAITWTTYRRLRDLKQHSTESEFKPFITQPF